MSAGAGFDSNRTKEAHSKITERPTWTLCLNSFLEMRIQSALLVLIEQLKINKLSTLYKELYSMKIPVPVVLAIAALSIAALICATEGTTNASLSISASPSTFKSVGETITFTYTVDAIDYIKGVKARVLQTMRQMQPFLFCVK